MNTTRALRMPPRAGAPDGRPAVSVVIPAHNEAAEIAATLEALEREFGRRKIGVEMIVVDDGSNDGTAARVGRRSAAVGVRVLRLDTCNGKGFAIRHGMAEARGHVVVYTDADLPVAAESVATCAEAVLSGWAEVCVGNRFQAGSRQLGRGPLSRRLASIVYRRWSRLVVPVVATDPACCVKAFAAVEAEALTMQSRVDGYAFDVEALALAASRDAHILQIPVWWTDKREPIKMFRLIRLAIICTVDLVRIRGRLGGEVDDERPAPVGVTRRA